MRPDEFQVATKNFLHVFDDERLHSRNVGDKRARLYRRLIFFDPVYEIVRIQRKNDKVKVLYEIFFHACLSNPYQPVFQRVLDRTFLFVDCADKVSFVRQRLCVTAADKSKPYDQDFCVFIEFHIRLLLLFL